MGALSCGACDGWDRPAEQEVVFKQGDNVVKSRMSVGNISERISAGAGLRDDDNGAKLVMGLLEQLECKSSEGNFVTGFKQNYPTMTAVALWG